MKNALLILMVPFLFACAGPKGEQGEQGLQGSQGPVGADGNQITMVQFCPGTPVYPSVFPEVGLRINNQIYAVYSANGGFLTLLTDGNYLSDAIGSRCNFTISNGLVGN